MKFEKNKVVIIIFLCITLGLLTTAGFYLVQSYPKLFTDMVIIKSLFPNVNDGLPQPTPVNEFKRARLVSNEWSRYTDEQYGFTFAYPLGYTVSNTTYLPNKNFKLTLVKPPSKEMTLEVLREYEPSEVGFFQGRSPDGGTETSDQINWVRFYLGNKPKDNEDSLIRFQTEQNGKLYILTGNESFSNFFEILNAFIFSPS